MTNSTFDLSSFSFVRQTGAFGYNRWHQVSVGGHAIDVALVGSGAITLHAAVDKDGRLSRPNCGSAWTIRLHSTGGGKVDETIGGRHAAKGWEASCQRHAGFQFARALFGELWAKWFAPAMPAYAQAIVNRLREERINFFPSEQPDYVIRTDRIVEDGTVLSYDITRNGDVYGTPTEGLVRSRSESELLRDELTAIAREGDARVLETSEGAFVCHFKPTPVPTVMEEAFSQALRGWYDSLEKLAEDYDQFGGPIWRHRSSNPEVAEYIWPY